MDDRYVTIKKPNWRNYDIFFYEALYHALVEFLVKLKDGDNISKPIAHEDFVAEVGGTIIERLDGEPQTLPNPFLGEKFFTLKSMDLITGDLEFCEGVIQTSPTIQTVPLPEGHVIWDMKPALESLIAEYERLEKNNHDKTDWWNKASKIVPDLLD